MSKKNDALIEAALPSAVADKPLDGEIQAPANIKPVGERTHRATFASDNRAGGYMVRVEGPSAKLFAKREVPVTRYDGTETVVKLDKLIWEGPDAESGRPVALYKFVKNPAEKKRESVDF